MNRFKVYEDPNWRDGVREDGVVLVVFCLRCGHSESEHLPNREGCTREWVLDFDEDPSRKIHSCGCRDWEPSDPTPLRGKVTLDRGFVYAPYIPKSFCG